MAFMICFSQLDRHKQPRYINKLYDSTFCEVIYLYGGSIENYEKTMKYIVILTESALGLTKGFVKSFLESFTGWLAMLQLLCGQAREKLQEELLRRSMSNLTLPAV